MQTPKIDIVITQHTTLVELLRERGTIDADTPVIAHARPEDVRGRHVLGVLPHHLSSLASTITEIPIRFAGAEERRAFAGGDIPLDRLREIAGEPVTYTVRRDGGRFLQRHQSNLDRLDDLAACAYMASAREPVYFDRLSEIEQDGWRRAVSMALELTLPPEECNDGETMERARRDAAMARKNLEREITSEIQHREDLRRIRAERRVEQAIIVEFGPYLTRAQLAEAKGTLLDIVGKVLGVWRDRHDIGASELDEPYRARLLERLDSRGHTGVQL